jgi:hypothetical protein
MNLDDIQFLEVTDPIKADVPGALDQSIQYLQNVTTNLVSETTTDHYGVNTQLFARVWLTLSVLAFGLFSWLFVQTLRNEWALNTSKKTR